MKTTGQRETLKQFTERALEASLNGTLIPPTVYIPVSLRKRTTRLAEDDISVTLNPKSTAEIEDQIARADPTGFLIAIMQGQPIPQFVVGQAPRLTNAKAEIPHLEVRMELVTAPIELRTEVALELARRARATKTDPEKARYDAMIKKAADV